MDETGKEPEAAAEEQPPAPDTEPEEKRVDHDRDAAESEKDAAFFAKLQMDVYGHP